jgi:hypothetical protein
MGGVQAAIGAGDISGVREKSQEHRNLALDVDFPVDIAGMRLDRAGLDAQNLGDFAVSQTLANHLCNLSLARCKFIPALDIGPLSIVEQHRFVLLPANVIRMFRVWIWQLKHG